SCCGLPQVLPACAGAATAMTATATVDPISRRRRDFMADPPLPRRFPRPPSHDTPGPPATARSEILQDGPGLHRGGRRFPPLVLTGSGSPCAVERLLEGVAREDAEADRRTGVEGDPAEAVRHGVADVLEVGRATADDHAERHHHVIGA